MSEVGGCIMVCNGIALRSAFGDEMDLMGGIEMGMMCCKIKKMEGGLRSHANYYGLHH